MNSLTRCNRLLICLASLSLALIPATTACGDETGPDTITVEPERFRLTIELSGVLEAAVMTPVEIDAQAWDSLVITEAVAHGSAVTPGQVLIRTDTEDLDEEIANAQREVDSMRMSLARARKEANLQRRAVELQRYGNELAMRRARQDFDHFLEVELPRMITNEQLRIDDANTWFEYGGIKLEQLETMFGEESEADYNELYALSGQRKNREWQELDIEEKRLAHEHTVNVGFPRLKSARTEQFERNLANLKHAATEIELQYRRSVLEREQLQRQYDRQLERLDNLKADRDAMAVRSPTAGILYHGRCVRGRWQATENIRNALRRGGAIKAGDLVMTVVQPRPLLIRTAVGEDQIRNVHFGAEARATAKAYPEIRMAGTVTSVADVPCSNGTFDVHIALLGLRKEADPIVPGMTCTIELVAYEDLAAITLPEDIVFKDDSDGDYVYVLNEGGTPERRAVTLGRKAYGKVEILTGLVEDEQVLKQRPDAD